MSLENKTIAIIASNEFEDIELEYPLLYLSHQGADIKLVPVQSGHHPRPALTATESKPVTGRFGTPLPPEVMAEGNRYETVDFEDLTLEDLDCVLYPGGFSPDHLRVVPEVVEFTREAYEEGLIVASICHGPWMLVEADLAEGRDICAYEAIHTDLENAGATVVDEPAVQDGNIVTGRVPDDLPEFSEAVEAALEDHEAEPPTA
ncbi:protease [Natronolimnobius sp. AArcel1]|uniref:DJ-1/PfpI family protein n=1 Tax=Natronolimnobius sp. AArcel1 TaxID=1679093 RepID=UPI0013EAD04B|nr:DJ-1/PfpI family protein [Natronolimnobius sp. AArcel1]NGM70363.1 protease [Natronolimnobius sp. AArcel1]